MLSTLLLLAIFKVMPEEPRIEPASLITPPIPVPEIPPVAKGVEEKHLDANTKYLRELQRMEQQNPDNFFTVLFQNLQEALMNSIFAAAWNYVRSLNPKTTAAGLVALIVQGALALGIEIPETTRVALAGVFYAIIFNYSSIAWNWQKVVGIALMFLSFALTPLLSAAGLAISPQLALIVQAVIEQLVGALLQDAKEELMPSGGLRAAGLILILWLFGSSTVHAQDTLTSKIPCGFEVYSTHITVKYDSAYCEKLNAWGTYNHRQALIRLNNAQDTDKDRLHETFYHELTHCILENIERRDLSRNERFVAVFSRALRQALASMQYDYPQAPSIPQQRVYPD